MVLGGNRDCCTIEDAKKKALMVPVAVGFSSLYMVTMGNRLAASQDMLPF